MTWPVGRGAKTSTENNPPLEEDSHVVTCDPVKVIGSVAAFAIGGVGTLSLFNRYFDYKTLVTNNQHQITMADLQYRTQLARTEEASIQRAAIAGLQSRIPQPKAEEIKSAPLFDVNLTVNFNLLKFKKK